MYFCLSRFLKKRKMYVQADKRWLPAFHFTTNFVFWQTYIMSRSSFVHFFTQTTFLNYKNSQYLHESISHGKKFFFSRFLYKSSIVFHQNNFFELRWDYTSNIVSLQCLFFWSVFLQFRISRTKWRWHGSTFSFSVSSRLSMSASSSHIGSTS